ncbi:MAG: DUF2917 domain-containing protein [Rhodoferax sp.]
MYQIENFEFSTPRVVAYRLKAGCVIRITSGRLWLTLQGSPDDLWLQAGESWTMPVVNGTLWLSAEPAAELQMAQPISMRRRPSLLQPFNFGGKVLANTY